MHDAKKFFPRSHDVSSIRTAGWRQLNEGHVVQEEFSVLTKP